MSDESKIFNSRLLFYLGVPLVKLTGKFLNNKITPIRWKKIGGIVSSKELNNAMLPKARQTE